MDLGQLAGVIWRRKLLVLAVLLLTLGAAVGFSRLVPIRYAATTTIALTPNFAKGDTLVIGDALSSLLTTYSRISESAQNRQRAQGILRRPLRSSVTADSSAGTGILQITAKGPEARTVAEDSRALATAFTQSLVGNRLLVATVVEPAATPTQPVQPRPPLILTIAGLLGLIAGTLIALAVERQRSGLDDPEDLMEATDIPLLANVPEARGMRRGRSLSWDDPELRDVHEAFRFMRTSLLMSAGAHDFIQVTSLDPGQGKSSVVSNLGVALAQLGRDVVIVDADLRRPVQHVIFDVSNERGLSSLLVRGDMDFQPLPTRFPGLSVVPAGALLPNPTELLHVRLAAVATRFRREGRIVLFDSPPLSPVSDARLLARSMDGVILVIDAGSRVHSLNTALEQLRQVDAPILGIVLNRTESDGESYSPYRMPSGIAVGGRASS